MLNALKPSGIESCGVAVLVGIFKVHYLLRILYVQASALFEQVVQVFCSLYLPERLSITLFI